MRLRLFKEELLLLLVLAVELSSEHSVAVRVLSCVPERRCMWFSASKWMLTVGGALLASPGACEISDPLLDARLPSGLTRGVSVWPFLEKHGDIYLYIRHVIHQLPNKLYFWL